MEVDVEILRGCRLCRFYNHYSIKNYRVMSCVKRPRFRMPISISDRFPISARFPPRFPIPISDFSPGLDAPDDIVEWRIAPAVPRSSYRAGARSVVVLFADRGS
jgi:hypothetical protein